MKINKIEPVESYFCIIDTFASIELIVNPFFCNESFDVIKTSMFMPGHKGSRFIKM